MRRFFAYGLTIALLAACSTQEKDFQTPTRDDVVFYASFEQPAEEGTRVYANEDLYLRWTADDRVSIFNMNTYNQQYRFAGETGDNAGGFDKVAGSEFVTGNAISHVVSVYPYDTAVRISESETVTLTLPAVQHYAENSFGLGANTMVSVSSDNFLQYKNVGGYLMLKLYGNGVSVSSITLKGNNGEKLAGKATVTMPLNGVPTAVMANDATTEITLVCDVPVALSDTAEQSKFFWIVLPPITFSKGFTISVTQANGGVVEKSTSNSISIERNNLSKMSPIEVECLQPNRVIYYTSTDGEIVTPKQSGAFDGATIVSNEYANGRGTIIFDKDVKSIGPFAFEECITLKSIILPESVTSLGIDSFHGCTSLIEISIPDAVDSIMSYAFWDCSSLSHFSIPEGITRIEDATFYGCSSLSQISLPESIVSLGQSAFSGCSNLSSISLPYSLTSIGDYAFFGCSHLLSINLPEGLTTLGQYAFNGCTRLSSEIVIPKGVTIIKHSVFQECESIPSISLHQDVTMIDGHAFAGCKSLKEITIPSSVSSIGSYAFALCSSLTSVTCLPTSVPSGNNQMFSATTCIILVPAESVDAYKSTEYWNDYADRIYAIGTPIAVDLGLSVKWSLFNLGASKPEEYGDYYAWGETEPKDGCFLWGSYKWCMGEKSTLTKYCSNPENGNDGFTDTKTILDLEDDAAHVNWGGKWRMPTDAEWKELINNCTWTWTTRNGVSGMLFTGPNGKIIFLPAAGDRFSGWILDVGNFGGYWSSSLNTDSPDTAWYVYINNWPDVGRDSVNRYYGYTVRPVYAE